MESQEVENVGSLTVSCTGGEGIYGHPKIYLDIDPKKKYICCPYCGKKFVLVSK